MPEYRAHFDFDIRFANGGGLTGDGVPARPARRPTSPSDEIGLLLVAHLGLALVDAVELRGLRDRRRAAPRQPRGRDGCRARRAPTRVVDLSHPIRAGLVTYPGLPAPTITPHLTREDSRARYAPGTEFAMDIITMIGNTGTYLDSPFHRYAEGPDLAGLDLSTLVGLRAEVFHLEDAWTPERRGIRPETLADRDVRGAAVLLHTGWDRWFGQPEYGARRAVPHRRGRAVADRRRRRAGRHRLAQHRRHRVRRRAPRALAAARRRACTSSSTSRTSARCRRAARASRPRRPPSRASARSRCARSPRFR